MCRVRVAHDVPSDLALVEITERPQEPKHCIGAYWHRANELVPCPEGVVLDNEKRTLPTGRSESVPGD